MASKKTLILLSGIVILSVLVFFLLFANIFGVSESPKTSDTQKDEFSVIKDDNLFDDASDAASFTSPDGLKEVTQEIIGELKK
ncbi:MAG: hypothetical protein FWF32_03400 [Endomicrobia bacterium]|nr:hypothetical protein [Endomicrobiia bacterium]